MASPPTLFTYLVVPTSVPYTDDPATPSTVTLLLAVANNTGKDAVCTEIDFLLPASLTTNPSSVMPSAALGTAWTIVGDGNGKLTATPRVPSNPLAAGDSIAFIVSGVQVAQGAGIAGITVYEMTDQLRQGLIDIVKVPPGLAITSFVANPIQVNAGNQTVLSWTTTAATTCTLSWPGGNSSVPVNGSFPVNPTQTTTYILTAAGTGTAVS